MDYVKTSTGKAGPATLHHVEVMAQACKGRAKIKAAGGIRTVETVEKMLDLGPSKMRRIGGRPSARITGYCCKDVIQRKWQR